MPKLSKFIFVMLFLLISLDISAEDRYFKWIDPKTQTRYRINIDNSELLQEPIPGKWDKRGKVNVNPQIFNNIPPLVVSNYFFYDNGNRVRFTIQGSGHVFDYLLEKNELIRVDNTFHNGYNYISTKFKRKDMLYSIGGEGFWTHSNVITYFDEKLKEWEILRPKNIGPPTICEGYQGYDNKNDVYYSGASHNVNFLEEQSSYYVDDFFSFDFKKNNWKYLGNINPDLPFRKESMILWTGKWFLKFDNSTIYIIDPGLNEVRSFKDYTKTLIFFNDYVIQNDTLIAFKEKNSGPLNKISLSDLRSKSVYWGRFYSHSITSYSYYIAALTLIFLLGFSYWRYNKVQKIKNFNFTHVEKKLLHKLLLLKPNEYLTTHDINSILEASDKSQENQRRIRFNVINQLNNKLKLKLGTDSGVERKSLPEDKRLTVYVLDQHIISELRKLVQE